jgi:hypothetical protein
MKEFLEDISGAFIRVWKKQMDISLPQKFTAFADRGSEYELLMFPLAGWLAGIVLLLPALLIQWLFNDFAGAFVFALCAWLFLTFRDSGRSDAIIAGIIAGKMPGEQIPWRIAVPVFMQIMKFALLMQIFYSGNLWHLPLMIGGMFLLEALLTLNGGFDPPLLDDSPAAVRNMWIITAILGIISLMICRMPAILGTAAFLLIWKIFQSRCDEDGTDLGQISVAGGITLWALLFAGLLSI